MMTPAFLLTLHDLLDRAESRALTREEADRMRSLVLVLERDAEAWKAHAARAGDLGGLFSGEVRP